jgi:hypothetical protein
LKRFIGSVLLLSVLQFQRHARQKRPGGLIARPMQQTQELVAPIGHVLDVLDFVALVCGSRVMEVSQVVLPMDE